MDKQIKNGIKHAFGFSLFFITLFSVTAVGFHLASEILPGTFSGNFIFNSNVEIQGNLTNKGVATAWVNFDGSNCINNLCSIRDSYNVRNVTYVGSGSYLIYFETLMIDTNYVLSGLSLSGYQMGQGTSNLEKVAVSNWRELSDEYLDVHTNNIIIFGGKN